MMTGNLFKDTRLLVFIGLTTLTMGCASNNERSKEMEDHFASLEAQQLKELESAEEARKLALRSPPKPVNKIKKQEKEKNQRYEKAVAAAEGRIDNGEDDANNSQESVLTSPIQAPSLEKAWQAHKRAHPVSGKLVCTIFSSQSKIDNGGLETLAQIIVTADSVFLRTDATLDAEATRAGIQIDDSDPFELEIYPNDVTAVVEDQYRSLLIQMALGNSLKASFRYKPHKAETDHHSMQIEMAGFAQLLDELNSC